MVAPVITDNNSTALRIGLPSFGPGVSEYVQAYLDEFRVAKGAARHVRDYVTPTWTAAAVQHDGGDDYYNNLGLLITGQGADGSNPVDSGPGAKTLTLNGTTITTTQFKYGTSSVSFNGSSRYIAVDGGTYAGDFTLQYWARGDYFSACSWSTTGTTYLYNGSLFINGSSITNALGGNWFSNPGSSTWNHVCLMRSAGTIYLFINGVLTGRAANSTSLNLSALQIGRYAPGANLYFNGQMQDISIGSVARYATNGFDIPAALHPTFQSNLGDPLYTSYTKLLARANGSNGSTTFTDESPAARTLTTVGGAQISTAQSFAGGSSMLLSGATDAVTAAASADLNLGGTSAQFTVDFRLRLTSLTGKPWIFQFEIDANNRWGMYVDGGILKISAYSNGVETTYHTNKLLSVNTWYYVEVSKFTSNSTPQHFFKVFVDGTFQLLSQANRLFTSPLNGKYGPALTFPGANPSGKTVDATPIRPNTKPLVISLFLPKYRGTKRIAGTVKVITTLAPYRKVRLYDKVSGELVQETTSDGSGAYFFNNLDGTRQYYVTAFDNVGGYNATIEDFVTPA